MSRLRTGLAILSLLCAAGTEARGYRWASSGPDGGPVLSIAFGPVGSHAMYCVAGQEVFRSTDRGDSWLGTGAKNVFAVAADPSGGPVLYALGGNTDRSGDSGATWVRKTPPPDNFTGALAIDSGDPDTVYAGFFPSVWRSTDGGQFWQETNLTGVAAQAAVADPSRPEVVYVSSPAPGACPGYCSYDVYGIWKSTDGGGTWAQPPGLPDDLFYAYALAIDPMDSDTIYAGCLGDRDGMTIFKSTDGGAQWSEADAGMNHLAGVSFVGAIVIDPGLPSTLFASSDQGFWESTDGAATWTLMNPGPPLADSIAIDPEETTRIFAGDFSGLHRSLDGGRTWRVVNNGRPFASIHCLAGDASDVRTVYTGTDVNGLFRTTDNGINWLPVGGDLSFDSVSSVSVDPFNRSRIYATLPSHGVYLSTDAGTSWSNVLTQSSGSCCAYEVTAATGASGLVYATSTDGLLASHDGGSTWSLLRSDIWIVLPEPRRPGWLYGLGMGPEGNQGVLLRSTDGGGTWSEIGPLEPGTNSRASLEAISLDPADPDVLFCGAGNGGFFVTTDGGETWSHDPFIGASSIAVQPGDHERISAGFGSDVMESTDGGATWISINEGLRGLTVTSLLAAGGLIHAGTSSNGVFEYLPDPDHLAPITAPPPGQVGGR